MRFTGFSAKMQSVPLPSAVFGPLLEEIDDLSELKCTLRVMWLIQQKKGHPRVISSREILADRTLAKALDSNGSTEPSRVIQALDKTVKRGTLHMRTVISGDAQEQLYALNSDANRLALAQLTGEDIARVTTTDANPWEASTERPNIFALYEDNIGMLNPMISDELKEAERTYPSTWIEDAFREAVVQNKRSWRYVERILERWEREGKVNGEPWGHTKKPRYY